MIDISGHRQHQSVRRIVLVQKVKELISSKTRDRFRCPDYRGRHRMASVDLLLEADEDEIFGCIIIHFHLLEYHIFLFLDFSSWKVRFKDQIEHRVDCSSEMFVERSGKVAGKLFRGEGIEITADRFQALSNVVHSATSCPFEHHVLDEVADAGFGCTFVSASCFYPRSD